MRDNTNLISTIISVVGGIIGSLIIARYGSSLAKKSRTDDTSDAQTILNLQKSVQKRNKTVQYLESKVKKEEVNIAQLKALNEQLRVANEKEVLYIAELQQRITTQSPDKSQPGTTTAHTVN